MFQARHEDDQVLPGWSARVVETENCTGIDQQGLPPQSLTFSIPSSVLSFRASQCKMPGWWSKKAIAFCILLLPTASGSTCRHAAGLCIMPNLDRIAQPGAHVEGGVWAQDLLSDGPTSQKSTPRAWNPAERSSQVTTCQQALARPSSPLRLQLAMVTPGRRNSAECCSVQ